MPITCHIVGNMKICIDEHARIISQTIVSNTGATQVDLPGFPEDPGNGKPKGEGNPPAGGGGGKEPNFPVGTLPTGPGGGGMIGLFQKTIPNVETGLSKFGKGISGKGGGRSSGGRTSGRLLNE